MNDSRQVPINYLYFGLFFLLLLFISSCSMIVKENLIGSRFFFLFYAIGQAALETLFIIFAGWVIRRWCGNLCFWLFIGSSFILGVLHIFDFLLDRVLDFSILRTLSFVFDESFDNFIYLLRASGVPLWIWAIFFGLIASLPFIGMALYKGTDFFVKKRPLLCRPEVFLQAFVCIPAALVFWDFSASRMVHPDAYTAFRKSLPWKETFLHPRSTKLISGKLVPPKNEIEVISATQEVELSASKKPSIFLFVVESLREDYLTQATAPHLLQFRQDNIRAEMSLSNANSTMISWFSIFHSQFPYFWNNIKKTGWKSGSPALALFKKMGYKIRVYTSAELGYYGLDELIFGEKMFLADSFQNFDHTPPKPTCAADKNAIGAVKHDLATDPTLAQGNLFVIFLDSTHFDYSWPREGLAKFTPFGSEISYFRAYQSQKNIDLIKNRYRNAIHYVDSLFGEFLQFVPTDSFVVFTGDHGEEFFDQGHLFHNSHLSKSQTTVPIYMRINNTKLTRPLLSHLDIMPTLLDGVYGSTFPFLQGESALREKTWPFVTIARFNGNRSPYEWCIHNGREKLILQFTNEKTITESSSLRVLSFRSAMDTGIPEYKKEPSKWIQKQFSQAFDRLFLHD